VLQYDPTQLLNDLKEMLKEEGIVVNEVNAERSYWFIRTQGGSYFDEFFFGKFVAIGWDNVPCIPESERTQQIIDQLKDKGYGQPTRVMNQVYRFCTELKKGDVVIIPSESSLAFAFGYIESDVYEVTPSKEDEEEVDATKCQYTRRRNVKWVTDVPRSRVDPRLYAFFRNQQALSYANHYADFIDRALSSFYVKNNIAHFTLSVEIEKSPRAEDIPTYMHGILARVSDLAVALGLIDSEEDDDDTDKEHISSRINVQSEGIIELLGNPAFVFLVSIIVVSFFGGKAAFKSNKEITSGEVATPGLPGLLKVISQILLDHKKDKFIGDKKIVKVQERLKIKDPREK